MNRSDSFEQAINKRIETKKICSLRKLWDPSSAWMKDKVELMRGADECVESLSVGYF